MAEGDAGSSPIPTIRKPYPVLFHRRHELDRERVEACAEWTFETFRRVLGIPEGLMWWRSGGDRSGKGKEKVIEKVMAFEDEYKSFISWVNRRAGRNRRVPVDVIGEMGEIPEESAEESSS